MPTEKEMIGGCCVCGDERGYCENPIVYCDGERCNLAVHQACYGIQNVPSGDWFCQPCELKVKSAKCELCPASYGALKLTDTKKWAHVVCALYIPELRFGNISTMEPIEMNSLQKERLSLSCMLCEVAGRDSLARIGACITCNYSSCSSSFHVTCAQLEGLLCEVVTPQSSFSIKYQIFCPSHIQKKKRSSTTKIRHLPAYKPPKLSEQYKTKSNKINLNYKNCKTPSLNLSSTSSSSSSPSSPETHKKSNPSNKLTKNKVSPNGSALISNGNADAKIKSDSSKPLTNKTSVSSFKQHSFSSSTSSMISTPVPSNNLTVPRKRTHSSSSSSSSNQSNSGSSDSESDYDSDSGSSSTSSDSKTSNSESESEVNTSCEKSVKSGNSTDKSPNKTNQHQSNATKKIPSKDTSLLIKESSVYKFSKPFGDGVKTTKSIQIKKEISPNSNSKLVAKSNAEKRRKESSIFKPGESSNQVTTNRSSDVKTKPDVSSNRSKMMKNPSLSESSSDPTESDNDSDEDFSLNRKNKTKPISQRKLSVGAKAFKSPDIKEEFDNRKIAKDSEQNKKQFASTKSMLKRSHDTQDLNQNLLEKSNKRTNSIDNGKLLNGVIMEAKDVVAHNSVNQPTESLSISTESSVHKIDSLLMLNTNCSSSIRATIPFDALSVPHYSDHIQPFGNSATQSIDRPPTPNSFEEYLEYNWIHTSHYLMDLEENRDISQLIKKFNLLKQCNQKLEENVRQKKEQLQQYKLLNFSIKSQLLPEYTNKLVDTNTEVNNTSSTMSNLSNIQQQQLGETKPMSKNSVNSSLTNLLAASQLSTDDKVKEFVMTSQSAINSNTTSQFMNCHPKLGNNITTQLSSGSVSTSGQSYLTQSVTKKSNPSTHNNDHITSNSFRSNSQNTAANSLLSLASNNPLLNTTIDTSVLQLSSMSNGGYNNHHHVP